MGWADRAIAELLAGDTTQVRPRGNSMQPRISSGQLVTIEPAGVDAVDVGDAVLCRVSGRQYLHIVKAKQAGRVLIGNNRGGINGWTRSVYGRVVSVED